MKWKRPRVAPPASRWGYKTPQTTLTLTLWPWPTTFDLDLWPWWPWPLWPWRWTIFSETLIEAPGAKTRVRGASIFYHKCTEFQNKHDKETAVFYVRFTCSGHGSNTCWATLKNPLRVLFRKGFMTCIWIYDKNAFEGEAKWSLPESLTINLDLIHAEKRGASIGEGLLLERPLTYDLDLQT